MFKDKKDSIILVLDFQNEDKNILIKGDFNIKENIKIVNSPTNDFLKYYRNVPNNQLENIFKTIKDPIKIQFFLKNLRIQLQMIKLIYFSQNQIILFKSMKYYVINIKYQEKDQMFSIKS